MSRTGDVSTEQGELPIIVIGAGIMGVCVAENLRRAGQKVVLIDKVLPGDQHQASYGNAGILAQSAIVPVSAPGIISQIPSMILNPGSPLFLKWRYLPQLMPWLIKFLMNSSEAKVREISSALDVLIADSVEQHISLSKGTPAEKFIREGDWTYYYRDKEAMKKDLFAIRLRKANNIKFEIFENEDLWKKDPFLSRNYKVGVSYLQHGWISDPGGYVSCLANYFLDNGGSFLSGEVSAIEKNRILLTNGSSLSGKKIVVACGAWSKRILKGIKVEIPLESERGYHIYLKEPSFMPSGPRLVVENKFGISPMKGGLRVAGLVEFGGLDLGASKHPFRYLKHYIKKVFPDLTWSSETIWMGHRPTLSDSLPMIGRLKDNPHIICAFGGQHVGLTMAPKVGKIIADISADRRLNYDIDPFSPDRF